MTHTSARKLKSKEMKNLQCTISGTKRKYFKLFLNSSREFKFFRAFFASQHHGPGIRSNILVERMKSACRPNIFQFGLEKRNRNTSHKTFRIDNLVPFFLGQINFNIFQLPRLFVVVTPGCTDN